jgi:hypothetical protein
MMARTVDVTIPVDVDAAAALADACSRDALGDAEVEAELATHKAESRDQRSGR